MGYLLIGGLWIWLSDSFAGSLSPSKEAMAKVSMLSAWAYVGIAAIFIYFLSNHYGKKMAETSRHLQESYDELTATHEELTATEEELRQQFSELFITSEKLRNQNQLLATLQELTVALVNNREKDTLLHRIVYHAGLLIGTPHSFLFLLDEKKQTINLKVGLGLFDNHSEVFELKSDVGQAGLVIQTGQVSSIHDYGAWEQRLNFPCLSPVKSMIQVPLQVNEIVIGTIGVAFTEDNRLDAIEYVELLVQFAALASMTVENEELHAHLQLELEHLENKEKTIRAIFNATNDAIIVHDAETTEVYDFNSKSVELLGYTLEEFKLLWSKYDDLNPVKSKVVEAIKRVITEGPQLIEWAAVHKSGALIPVEANFRKAVINDKVCALASIRDISERKQADAELFDAQAQKLALLDAIPDLIVKINVDGTFLDYKKTLQFFFAYTPEMIIGKTVFDITAPTVAEGYIKNIQKAIFTGRTQFYEYEIDQNGEKRYREARIVKSSETEVLAIVRDITYKKQMADQLEYLSLNDSLTGVSNRTCFEAESTKLERQNKQIGVIICDVDGLKLINDTLGHRVGDELLCAVAMILRACFSEKDIVARIGGDEFAVLVSEPDHRKLVKIHDVIQTTVDEYNLKNPKVPLSLSVGWATSKENGGNVDVLFKEADNNMYREKMHKGLSIRSAIVQALMHALEARDYITEGHADRLQSLVEGLGRRLELRSQQIADLRLFAKFHDIGKVGIPDGILFKKERLSPEETTVMRRHSEIGFRIAKSAPDLTPIAEWILKHQEWWNGTGYPLGLAGEDIPLECRILAIADAYDAMTNDRPYRNAMNHYEAVDELRRCIGSQFDPMLTELFIEALSDINAIQ